MKRAKFDKLQQLHALKIIYVVEQHKTMVHTHDLNKPDRKEKFGSGGSHFTINQVVVVVVSNPGTALIEQT